MFCKQSRKCTLISSCNHFGEMHYVKFKITVIYNIGIFCKCLTTPLNAKLSLLLGGSGRVVNSFCPASIKGQVQSYTSVKARLERWCRWNCDLRVINARIKGIFCHTEGVAMMPKSRDHMPTTSLWGVTAKWPTRVPRMNLILCPRDPQGSSRISLSLSGRILKEYQNIVSASTCGIPWGLQNRTHWSAHYTNGRDVAQQESQLIWIV